jgi:hypothetical protein
VLQGTFLSADPHFCNNASYLSLYQMDWTKCTETQVSAITVTRNGEKKKYTFTLYSDSNHTSWMDMGYVFC